MRLQLIHPNWSGISVESIRSLCLSTYLPEEVMKLNDIAEMRDTERVRIEESGTKTDVTRLISARMATEFERGLYYGKNE